MYYLNTLPDNIIIFVYMKKLKYKSIVILFKELLLLGFKFYDAGVV